MLGIIPTFFVVTALVFSMVQLIPGGIMAAYLSTYTATGYVETQEYVELIEKQFGLDKPIWMQYFLWLRNLLTGNFGFSFKRVGWPVADLLWKAISNSFGLMLGAILIAYIIAVPLGVISSIKQYSVIDHISRVFSLFGISMPAFWMGLMFIYTFAVRFDLFPTQGMYNVVVEFNSPLEAILDRIMHAILPMTVIAIGSIGFCSRLTRSSMLDVLRSDYITTARAKGLRERVVIYKHALRNALLPVITLVNASFIRVITGAVATEMIFAWPGIGRLIVQSAQLRDLPVLMAILVVTSLVVVIINLFTDIVYAFIDPRIRYA
jgi:peptide/nickel transport system permease protein